MPEMNSNPPEEYCIPEKSRAEWGIALLLFAFSVLCLWPFLDYTALYPDEGITLEGAQRILRAQVPYRDFFTFFTPGTYYWTALRFKVLGTSFLAGRVVLLLYGGLLSLALYMMARRVCSRWMAILTAYLFFVIGLPYQFLVLHNWDSTMLAVLALYAGIVWIESAHATWALLTGVLVSLTCLFEQSKGAGLVLGLGIGMLIIARHTHGSRVFKRTNVIALGAGFVCPALLTLSYFAHKGALVEMVSGCLWPLTHYSEANRLPYGYIPLSYGDWEELYGSGSVLQRLFHMSLTSPFFVVPSLPLLAVTVLVVVFLGMRKNEPMSSAHAYCILVATCSIGLVLGVVATGRPEANHLFYVSPPLILLLGGVLAGRIINPSLLSRTKPLLVVFLLLTFTAFGMILYISGPFSARQSLETRRGHIKLPCCDTVITFLESHVPPGARVFVYPYQPLYYFLTDTRSPTQFDYLQLGLHTQEQMRQAMDEVEADRTSAVVYAPTFNTSVIANTWPSTPQRVLDADIVRDYIFARYRPCGTLRSLQWSQVFLTRKDRPCPGNSTPTLRCD